MIGPGNVLVLISHWWTSRNSGPGCGLASAEFLEHKPETLATNLRVNYGFASSGTCWNPKPAMRSHHFREEIRHVMNPLQCLDFSFGLPVLRTQDFAAALGLVPCRKVRGRGLSRQRDDAVSH